MNDRPTLSSEEWTTIGDRADTGSEYALPTYDAKLVADSERDLEVVMVRERYPGFEDERIYNLPRSVFESVVARLPEGTPAPARTGTTDRGCSD